MMHYARLQGSQRLQRVLLVLRDHLPHGTWEIMQRARVCAVNSIISELRANGFQILCEAVGRGHYTYTLQ